MSAEMRFFPAHSLVLISTSNVSETEFDAQGIADMLTRIFRGESVTLPAAITDTASLTTVAMQELEGMWSFDSLGTATMIPAGDHLAVRVEGQPLINLVLQLDDGEASRYAARNLVARDIVHELSRGEYGLLRARWRGEAPATPLAAPWAALVRQNGAFDSVTVLGTAPVWYASPDATWLRLHFRNETVVRRFHWDSDGSWAGLGGALHPAPVILRCVGIKRGGCAGFHFAQPTRAVHFRRNDGELRLAVGGDSVFVGHPAAPERVSR
jgi:hypothetical protein